MYDVPMKSFIYTARFDGDIYLFLFDNLGTLVEHLNCGPCPLNRTDKAREALHKWENRYGIARFGWVTTQWKKITETPKLLSRRLNQPYSLPLSEAIESFIRSREWELL